MKKYKVGIYGCGSIGALKPDKFDSLTSKHALTHANAVNRHPRLDLSLLIDNDTDKENKACKKWNVINSNNIGIAVIATPAEVHKCIFDWIALPRISSNPALIICEKPCGGNIEDCANIGYLMEKFKDPLVVNYNRRYEKYHQMIHWNIQNNFDFDVIACRVLYGRGLMHDGCHALDLMNWWFENMIECKTKKAGVKESGFDESYSFSASYDLCDRVDFIPIDSKLFGIFEIDLLTTKGRYVFSNNGATLYHYPLVKGDDWGDYPVLGHQPDTCTQTELHSTLTNMYNNVVDHLDNGTPLLCTGKDALKVWEVYNKIKES